MKLLELPYTKGKQVFYIGNLSLHPKLKTRNEQHCWTTACLVLVLLFVTRYYFERVAKIKVKIKKEYSS